MNNIANPYIGTVCRKGKRVVLGKSPAGYYLGTWDDDGPCCRISDFAGTKEGAEFLIPNRICEENIFCNGGCGCGIQLIPESLIEENNEDDMVYYAVEEKSVKLVAVSKKTVEEAAKGLPSSWTAEEIVAESLEGLWKEEKIVLTSDHFQEVYFKKVTEESEYGYLLDHKDKAQIIDTL